MEFKPLHKNPYDKIAEESIRSAREGILAEMSGKYPEDIFPPISPRDLRKINLLLKRELGFPLDRLSAHIMRKKENIDVEIVKNWIFPEEYGEVDE
jgi:hypothetical protein